MPNTDPTPPAPPIACDLTVLTSEQRDRVTSLAVELFGRAASIEVLDDGYDVVWSDTTTDTIVELAEFVAYDAMCCTFLEHSITVDAGPGATHLRLTGREGAREAIAADFAPLLPPELAATAGLA